jgi:NADPH2:quinone reductase
MRAALVEDFGPPKSLVTGELPDPVAGEGEVLIEVAAAGVNFPDILVVAGSYQILPERPFSPGKEVAGTVRAVGAGVDTFAVGDRVLAQVEHGGYAELVAVPEPQVVALPDGVPFTDAAAFGLGTITAHFALVRRAQLQAGEVVLVTGAGGGVGSAGVQIAKALGATVIAVAQDETRAALAKEQGADHVLLAGGALKDEVFALTGGHGADVVLEMVGGDVFAQALRATAWQGRLVVIGFASGDLPVVKAGHILVKNLAVMGLQVSDYRDREPESVRQAIEHMLELYLEGRLTVPVARTYPLEGAGEALEAVRSGAVTGKVVLVTGRGGDAEQPAG